VTDSVLPARQAADGSVRPETKIWVLDSLVKGAAVCP